MLPSVTRATVTAVLPGRIEQKEHFEIPISMHSLRRLHARLRGDTLELWLPREGEREGQAQNWATQEKLAPAYAFLNQVQFSSQSRIVSYSGGSASGIRTGVADELHI